MARVFAASNSKGAARLVLLALADVASDDGEVIAYARSHKRLAAKANIAEGSVKRCIKELVELGEVQVLEVGDGRRSSDYCITLEPANEGVRTVPPGGTTGNPRGYTPAPQGAHTVPPIIPSPTDVCPSPSLELQIPPPPAVAPPEPGSDSDPDFAAFWGRYPRKESKGEARRAWRAAVRKAGAGAILAGVERYASDPNLPARGFVPHPSTWLNGERWQDGPLPPRVQGPVVRGATDAGTARVLERLNGRHG